MRGEEKGPVDVIKSLEKSRSQEGEIKYEQEKCSMDERAICSF